MSDLVKRQEEEERWDRFCKEQDELAAQRQQQFIDQQREALEEAAERIEELEALLEGCSARNAADVDAIQELQRKYDALKDAIMRITNGAACDIGLYIHRNRIRALLEGEG